MDSNDSQSPHTLTDEQMAILVAVVLEKFGRLLVKLNDEGQRYPSSAAPSISDCEATCEMSMFR